MIRKLALFVLAVVGLAILIATWRHWVAVHLGLVNAGPDPYYNFWSGFGSDLGYATFLAGGIAAYRHHNCHVTWCPLLGKPVDGTPYLACPKHHPAHKGAKRAVSLGTIDQAHRERKC